MYSLKQWWKVVFVPKSIFLDEPASGLRYVNERNEKQGVFPLRLVSRFSVRSCGHIPLPVVQHPVIRKKGVFPFRHTAA